MSNGGQLQKIQSRNAKVRLYNPMGHSFPEVYPKYINKIMQAAETLQEICEDVGILDNLNSDRAP